MPDQKPVRLAGDERTTLRVLLRYQRDSFVRKVHDVGDDAASHQIDEERREAGLHDMAAEHEDDASLAPGGGDDRVDDVAKVAGDEDVGQRR